jgi:sugar diacid utilization regulator
MALRADTTTWELVPEKVRRFLEEDAQEGGPLLSTFLGYVESDLNVKLAGRRLHMHTNTARYRLGRIAERTGLDMRSFEDVTTLYVAARLFAAH